MDFSLIPNSVINITSASERCQRRNSVPTAFCSRLPTPTTSFVITPSMWTVAPGNMFVSLQTLTTNSFPNFWSSEEPEPGLDPRCYRANGFFNHEDPEVCNKWVQHTGVHDHFHHFVTFQGTTTACTATPTSTTAPRPSSLTRPREPASGRSRPAPSPGSARPPRWRQTSRVSSARRERLSDLTASPWPIPRSPIPPPAGSTSCASSPPPPRSSAALTVWCSIMLTTNVSTPRTVLRIGKQKRLWKYNILFFIFSQCWYSCPENSQCADSCNTDCSCP